MNYRLITDGAIRIETTHAAATPGGNIYGTLHLARAHLDLWIKLRMDDLRAARKEWLHKPERELPSDEPALFEVMAPNPTADEAVADALMTDQRRREEFTRQSESIIDAGGIRPAFLNVQPTGRK